MITQDRLNRETLAQDKASYNKKLDL